MFRWILLLATSISYSAVDFKAPFDVRKLGSTALFDTVEVSTYLINNGTTGAVSPLYPSLYTVVAVGTDSFNLKSHSTLLLGAKSYLSYLDTIVVIRGPFTIFTWCDPLKAWGEGGGELVNNVRSQAFNFHPTIQQIHDTTVVYDTLRFHDTLKVVEKDTVIFNLHDTTQITMRDTIFLRDTIQVTLRDTIRLHDTTRVTVRDTIIKRDTVRVGPPTLAKASSLAYWAPVASVVYNAAGVKVWEGMLPPGGYPPAGLRPGLHLIVQGDKARRFRVAYR